MKLRIEKPDHTAEIYPGDFTFDSAEKLIAEFEEDELYEGCDFLLVDDASRPMKVWALDDRWVELPDAGFNPIGLP